MDICSVFLCLLFLTAFGVFSVDADEVKSESVMEGQNVTLHTDDIKQRDDKMVWKYGPENTFVARLNGKAIYINSSGDERFIDRVKLNHQTGDLTITHITSQHSGLYTLKISRNNKESNKKFNLTVNKNIINSINKQSQQDQDLTTDASPKSSDSPPMRVIIISVVVPLVICVIIIISIFIFIKHRRMSHKETVPETKYDPVSNEGSSRPPEESNSSTSPDELEKSPFCSET